MKKIMSLFFVVFVLGLGFSTMDVDTVYAAPIKLTYSNFFPPTHVQSQLAESWCREVEKRTQGAVMVDYYAGQTLTKARQCYDGTVEGLSDIGFSVLAYTRGRFPVMSAIDLPLGYTSGRVATTVANQVYDKFKPKELQDTEVMYLHAHGPGLLHTRDKAVRKLEDIKGLKIRSHGTSALVVKALGGTPVPKPMPESYQMLQKGVVDGSVYPLESNKGWKLGEVTGYSTAAFSAAYTTTFFVVMNKEKWQSIPPEQQTIIRQINQEWAMKHAVVWDTSDMEGLKFFLKQGGDVVGIDKKESERWKTAVAPIIEEYIQKVSKKGIDGKAVVDFTIQAIAENQ
jgi:TRAP-type transport system periplasmic protein